MPNCNNVKRTTAGAAAACFVTRAAIWVNVDADADGAARGGTATPTLLPHRVELGAKLRAQQISDAVTRLAQFRQVLEE